MDLASCRKLKIQPLATLRIEKCINIENFRLENNKLWKMI